MPSSRGHRKPTPAEMLEHLRRIIPGYCEVSAEEETWETYPDDPLAELDTARSFRPPR